jgi:hypothetical protein
MFELGEHDEFIFAIKNFDYIGASSIVYITKTLEDLDQETGEVLFKIGREESRNIKPGAFYNFSVRLNKTNPEKAEEYRKLTDNGRVLLEYGAPNLTVDSSQDFSDSSFINGKIVNVQLVPTEEA